MEFNIGDIVRHKEFEGYGFVVGYSEIPYEREYYTYIQWYDNGRIDLCGNHYIEKISNAV